MAALPDPPHSAKALRNRAGRAELILQELLRAGEVSVEALCRALEVDASTIRRDLQRLARQSLLKRVHGGAVPAEALSYTAQAHDLAFRHNMEQRVAEKTRIALAAARLIQPGETIAILHGTTTTHLARDIRRLQIARLTVVTNAVNIAMELAGQRSLNVLLTGGLLLTNLFALVGPTAEQNLAELYTDKAFISPRGVSVEHGLTSPNQLEALSSRVMLRRARQTIVLADHSKVGQIALHRITPVAAVHTLITDSAADQATLAQLAQLGIDVQLA